MCDKPAVGPHICATFEQFSNSLVEMCKTKFSVPGPQVFQYLTLLEQFKWSKTGNPGETDVCGVNMEEVQEASATQTH